MFESGVPAGGDPHVSVDLALIIIALSSARYHVQTVTW